MLANIFGIKYKIESRHLATKNYPSMAIPPLPLFCILQISLQSTSCFCETRKKRVEIGRRGLSCAILNFTLETDCNTST